MKILETDRLILRHQTVEDAAFMLGLWNDPSWIQNIGDRGVRTVEDARKNIKTGAVEMYEKWGYGFYLTELKDAGIPLGICGFAKRDFLEDPDVGFAFLPRYWGKGYAYEAASAVMEYGSSVLGFTRIAAFTSEDNEASGRLLVKLGLQFQRLIPYPGGQELVRLYSIDL
ncbi:GNAT family N-acetyltransferase [Tumebacillus permanentifrigoris]|uniref:RimJ/RimL family protein N-acetyltransferase n=1 Tax=Tumebacillus permanentifrigoris TaxID=378543 RepID=A0A316DW04_9BACL|nr:GNAT family N-acetyltransferase [Tumebacillus permanentifrigoris]PWK13724.1 RimJ/RimL family protein N-acetyltransferase [Tumebacillus permanentifrigoris]